MSDNMPTSVQLDTNPNGNVTFATDVVATIAGLAATEVEGVASMSGTTGLVDILSRKNQTRNLTKGVKVDVQNNVVNVNITIVIEFGSPAQEVALNIQENVKKAIETMSGLKVSSIDVHIQGVSFERELKATAEIEQQQRQLLQKQEDEPAAEEAKQPEPAEAPAAPEAEAEPAEPAESLEPDEDDGAYELELEDVEDEPEDEEKE